MTPESNCGSNISNDILLGIFSRTHSHVLSSSNYSSIHNHPSHIVVTKHGPSWYHGTLAETDEKVCIDYEQLSKIVKEADSIHVQKFNSLSLHYEHLDSFYGKKDTRFNINTDSSNTFEYSHSPLLFQIGVLQLHRSKNMDLVVYN